MKGYTFFPWLVAVLAAGAATVLFLGSRRERENLEARIEAVIRERDAGRGTAEQLMSERDDLSSRFAQAKGEADELKARSTMLEARNGQLNREIAQLRDQLARRETAEETRSRQVSDLNRQLIEAKAAAAAAAPTAASVEQVAALQARIVDLETQLAALRNATGQPSVSPQDLARVPVDLRAQVIDVGPETAFVVLDVGTRGGAVPSIEMVLRHGSTVVARVRLTDVREYYSIAHILPGTGSGIVRPGDTATRS